jgi:general secretion pathway protein D
LRRCVRGSGDEFGRRAGIDDAGACGQRGARFDAHGAGAAVDQIQTKSGTLAYQIGTRTATTVLRLRDGENQVLAGLINDEDRRTARKLPGLGEVPVVGRLFGTQTDDTSKTEIVLSITPRVLRNIPKRYADEMEFEAGTETNLGQRSVGSAAATPGLPQPVASIPGARSGPADASAPSAATPGAPPGGAAGPITNLPSALARGTALSWQGPTQGRAGEPLAVQLWVQSSEPLSNVPLAVTFDPRVLQVMGVQDGDFLRQGGAQAAFSSRVDAAGSISITGTRSGGTGAVGSGVLATLTLRPLLPSAQATLQVTAPTVSRPDGQPASVQLPPPYLISIEP